MKALFVCLTDYQLLNSINIKKHLLTEQEADIIIFNNKIGTFELADRLQQTGIFQNVYVYSDYFKGLHKYLRGLSESRHDISFVDAIKGSLKNISLNLVQKIKSKEWVINKKIYKNKEIDFKQYNQFFGIGTKAFVGDCLNTILKYNECTNNIIDEGLATYLSYDWSDNCKVDNVYLYEPNLTIYKDKYNKFVKIPKIKKDDKEFINIINFVFDFKDINKINLIDKVIFFDQNTDPMPKYLRNAGSIKKFIFANPYRKHLKEQIVYQTKIDLFKVLAEKYWPTRVFVKLHPRSNADYIKDYKDNKAEFFPNIFAPWEVFGCNYEIKNNVWITMYSSALCAYDFTIENNDNNKYIFLYRILDKYQKKGKYKERDKFFREFQSVKQERVFVPDSIEEFKNIIDNLKGEKKMNLSLTKNKNIYLFFLTLACVSGIGKFFIPALLCFIIYYCKNRQEFLDDLSSLKKYKSSLFFMMLFLITLLISGLFVESDTWLKLVRNNFQRMMPFIFVIFGLNGKELFNGKIKYILFACCLSMFIICVPVLDRVLIDGLYRPSSILGGPNILGGTLILVLPLMVSFISIISDNKKICILSIISICVLLITLFLIKSRGSWLGLGVMFAVIPFVLYKIKVISFKRLIFIEIILCILVAGGYFAFYEDLHRNYDFERPALREIAWQMFLANPIAGVGAGNFISTYVNENYVSPLVNSKHILVHPHNIYFNYLSEHGILGFTGFIALIIFQLKVLYKSIVKNNNMISIAMFLAMCAMLVHGWFDVCFTARYYAMTYWLLWGIVCYSIANKSKDVDD